MGAYNEEEQARRYSILHDRKKKLETFYNILYIITFVSDLIFTKFGVSQTGGRGMYFLYIGLFGAMVLQFLGIYNKHFRFTLCSLLPLAAAYIIGMSDAVQSGMLQYVLSIIPAAAVTCWALWLQKQWEALSQEEGFPHFKIDLNRTNQKAKTAERVTKRAAIAEGVRSDAAPNAGDMQDLLDTGAQAAAAELTGYHERSRHVSGVQTQRTISSGDMDEI